MKFDISTAGKADSKSWKHQVITWNDLCARLSQTHRTHETFKQYQQGVGNTPKEKKQWRDRIKDVGGFVGGMLSGGRRKADSVVHRQLITLDCDNALPSLWDDFTFNFTCAACMYSTHSHAPSAPRLRLVIPLDEPVNPAEYEAIARQLAYQLGINQVDHTCFRPSQLMYWPSTAKDGEYVFQRQDGEPLSHTEMLGAYADWTDTTEWPITDKEKELVRTGITKQGDPLEKPGIVGAFCRAYSITDAIAAFLPGVYDPTDSPDRYTYTAGTTGKGLVIYEDKFAYSHHGTDPTCGKLCNAFDLVRLHKFGLQDEDSDAPINKRPSYLSMQDLARKDDAVNTLLGKEQREQAAEAFSEMVIDEAGTLSTSDAVNDDWMAEIDRDRNGVAANTINNLVLILMNDPAFKGAIFYDEFFHAAMFSRNMPWRKVTEGSRIITDADDHNMAHYIEHLYGISDAKLEKALTVVCSRNAVHPVRDYLNGLVWDGVSRVDSLLIDYFGAEDSAYTRAVTRKMLVGAVARVMHPGCKFEYVLTLVGEEGKGKSEFFSRLASSWFSDTFNFHMLQIGNKAYEALEGAWIIEIAELSGIGKAEDERIKGFLAACKDRYRPAYGKKIATFWRQNIFVAGTNEQKFLKGVNGNRRFWPVVIGLCEPRLSIFNDLLPGEVGQIWAEAVELYKAGEPLYLDGELAESAILKRNSHLDEHPWVSLIANYLDIPIPNPQNWNGLDRYERREYYASETAQKENGVRLRDRVCVQEIIEEFLPSGSHFDRQTANQVRECMKVLGWVEVADQIRYGRYGQQRKGYKRPENRQKEVTQYDL